MDNLVVNMLAPNTKDIKLDTKSSKGIETGSKETKNTFNDHLKKVAQPEPKSGKSVLANNVRDIPVNKEVAIKDLAQEVSTEDMPQHILELISTLLNLPLQDIQSVLKEMNYIPTDLLQPEMLQDFLKNIYGVQDTGELLLSEVNIKDMSTLCEKLSQMNQVIQGDNGQLLVEKTVADDEIIAVRTTPISTIDTVQATELQMRDSTMLEQPHIVESATAQNTLSGLLKEVQALDKELLSGEEIVGENSVLNLKEMGLGITIPIQSLQSNIGTKMWDTPMHTFGEIMRGSEAPPIINQVLDHIEIKTLRNHQEVTMQLSPKELGELSIKLTETNGNIMAHIRVENEKTRELMMGEIDKLKQMLQQQGLTVTDVKVDVRQNEHHSQMEQQKQKSARRIQEIIAKHFEEAELEEIKQEESIIETEVDYMV